MAKLLRPVMFGIVPANKGKNVSETARAIDMRESPDLMNVRFHHSQICTRDGFKSKYFGGNEAILWIDVTYASDGTFSALICYGISQLYQVPSGVYDMIPIEVFSDASAIMSLTTDPAADFYSVDVGEGAYDAKTINGGALYPASGYASIMAFTNQADGVFIVIPGAGGAPLEAEEIEDVAGVGLASARCVAFFAGRLVVGGSTSSNAELLWSADGAFEEFDPAADPSCGAKLLGDGADWIQNMFRMGDNLIIYKERSIYIGRKTYITDPPIAFEPAPGQGIGLAAPLSIGDLGEEHLFLGWDDVYTFSLNGLDTVGERIKDELFGRVGENGILPEYVHRCVGIIAEEFDEYWLFVPTGKFPTCENLLECGDCAFVRTTGDTHSNTTVDDITALDWGHIRVGDTIIGSNIPAGAYVVAKPSSGTVTISAAATATENDIEIWFGNVAAQPWSEATDDTATWTAKAGGNFGGIYQEIVMTAGAYAKIQQEYDYGSTQGAGIVISIVVWAKTEHTTTRTLRIVGVEVGPGEDGTSHSEDYDIAADEADWLPYFFSFTSVDADMEKVRVEVQTITVDAKLHVDAVQMIDITSLTSDDLYTDPTSGYQCPGYVEADNEMVMIPFIVDKCGPWVCDTVWVYNYEDDAWSCWRLPMCGFGYDTLATAITIADLEGMISDITWRYDDTALEAFSPTNLVSPVDGQVYEISRAYSKDYQGFTDRSSFVFCFWESKDFDLGRPHLDKTFMRLVIYHEVSHYPSEIIVGFSTDSGSTWEEQTVTIRTGFTETFADFIATGTQGRFKVRSSGQGIRLSGFAVKVVPRGETNVY